MVVTGAVIVLIGVFVVSDAASVSRSIGRGIRNLFAIRGAGDRMTTWGVRGAGGFAVLFGLALVALALFSM